MEWLWKWALSIDRQFAARLYALWEETPTIEFTRILALLAEYLAEDVDISFRKSA